MDKEKRKLSGWFRIFITVAVVYFIFIIVYSYPYVSRKYKIYRTSKEHSALSFLNEYQDHQNLDLSILISSLDLKVIDCYKKRKEHVIERIKSTFKDFDYIEYENNFLLTKYNNITADMINNYRKHIANGIIKNNSIYLKLLLNQKETTNRLLRDFENKIDFTDIKKDFIDCVYSVKVKCQKAAYEAFKKSLLLTFMKFSGPLIIIYILFWVVIPWIIRGFK